MNSDTPTTELGKPVSVRLTGLDSLRGIAAVGVMGSHFTGMHMKQHVPVGFSIPVFTDYGHYGVQLFFILSGFVIWITLQRKKTPREFAIARFLRLYPTFWICILLTSVFVLVGGSEFGALTPAVLLGNATMIPKQFLGINGFIDGSYWTLEYELYFYVIAACVFYFGGRPYLIPCFVGLSLLGVGWHMLQDQVHAGLLGVLGTSLIWRASGWFLLQYAHLFLIGMAIADYRANRRKFTVTALVIGVACAFSGGLSHGMIVLGLSAVVAFAATVPGTSLLHVRPVLFLGTISYPLYLLHQEIGYVVIGSLFRRGWPVELSMAFAVVLVTALAAAVTYAFEGRCRKWIGDALRSVIPVRKSA